MVYCTSNDAMDSTPAMEVTMASKAISSRSKRVNWVSDNACWEVFWECVYVNERVCWESVLRRSVEKVLMGIEKE